MTNTLHRFGDAQSFRDDYVVFAIASRGRNDENSVPRLKKFLEIARQFKPVNLGDSRHGGALRSSRSLNPLSHWRRNHKPDFDAVIAGVDTPTTVAAVFDNLEAAEACTKAVREADLLRHVVRPGRQEQRPQARQHRQLGHACRAIRRAHRGEGGACEDERSARRGERGDRDPVGDAALSQRRRSRRLRPFTH